MNGILSMYNLVSIIIPLSELFGFVNGSQKSRLSDIGNNNTIEGADKNLTQCHTKDECLETYTPGIDHGLQMNVSVVHEPQCIKGVCTCGIYCLSKSLTFLDEEFYYCGPCGRVGSTCHSKCSFKTAICKKDGFCHCYNGGEFYEASFCFVSFFGYEFALEMAIVTCIVIILGLLLAAFYNRLGTRRLRHLRSIRALLNEQNGTRESPPGDTPPKYEDLMQDLPTYQEAITMTMMNGHDGIAEEGLTNLAYHNDSGDGINENGAADELSVARREGSLAEMKRTIRGVRQADSRGENSEASDRCEGIPQHEASHNQMLTTDQPRRVTSNRTQDQSPATRRSLSSHIEQSGSPANSAENGERTIQIVSPKNENRSENFTPSIPNSNQTAPIANTSSSSLKLHLDDHSTTPLPILRNLELYAVERKNSMGKIPEEATLEVGNNPSQSSSTNTGFAAGREKIGDSPLLDKSSTTLKPYSSLKTHEMHPMSTTNGEDGEDNLARRSETVV